MQMSDTRFEEHSWLLSRAGVGIRKLVEKLEELPLHLATDPSPTSGCRCRHTTGTWAVRRVSACARHGS